MICLLYKLNNGSRLIAWCDAQRLTEFAYLHCQKVERAGQLLELPYVPEFVPFGGIEQRFCEAWPDEVFHLRIGVER